MSNAIAQPGLRIIPATTPSDIALIRALLVEYQKRLGVDLSFQNFDAEVRSLPGDYAPPAGRLLLALHDATAVGCVALRAAGGARCEMKRLFVRPGTRGLGVGRALVVRVVEEARAAGYAEMVLDTLPTMVDAQRLYERFGFRDIAAYRPNPVDGTRYLGKSLAAD
jgi:ribosomal protein S18 acetylase RimI-like enzyme